MTEDCDVKEKLIIKSFCTICGRQYWGRIDDHFYLEHKDKNKQYIPLIIQTLS